MYVPDTLSRLNEEAVEKARKGVQQREERCELISRHHHFEDRLTMVKKGRKYFYLWHEKSVRPVRILIDREGLEAFNRQYWPHFEKLEEATVF